MICLRARRGQVERSKENARDSPCDILLAEFPCLFVLRFPIRCNIAPQKRVLASLRSFRHALTNRAKDLGVSQIWDQQSEQQTTVIGLHLHIGPGSGTGLNPPQLTQFAKSPPDSDS